MPTVRFQFRGLPSAIGAAVLGVGLGAHQYLGAVFQGYRLAIDLFGGAALLVGTALTLAGFIRVSLSPAKVYDTWSDDRVIAALEAAPAHAEVSILQTSLANPNLLIPTLQRLLTEGGKTFKLRVLLTDPVKGADVIRARVKLRVDKEAEHMAEIETQINRLFKLKEEVDKDWEKTRSQAKLDLQVRVYDFLPFGSHHQIEKECIFVGIFLCHVSSINGPMIKVTDPLSKLWSDLETHFERGWKDGTPVVA